MSPSAHHDTNFWFLLGGVDKLILTTPSDSKLMDTLEYHRDLLIHDVAACMYETPDLFQYIGSSNYTFTTVWNKNQTRFALRKSHDGDPPEEATTLVNVFQDYLTS